LGNESIVKQARVQIQPQRLGGMTLPDREIAVLFG
jgi:hypothetical protein